MLYKENLNQNLFYLFVLFLTSAFQYIMEKAEERIVIEYVRATLSRYVCQRCPV